MYLKQNPIETDSVEVDGILRLLEGKELPRVRELKAAVIRQIGGLNIHTKL